MTSSKYKYLFFDLDHTLWDFEANSAETLTELFQTYNLDKEIESKEAFIKEYQLINRQLWDLFHKNLVDKETLRLSRFELTLEKFSVYNLKLSLKLSEEYSRIAPSKGKLFKDVHEVLAYLQNKYRLHLITNGFKEVQGIKIETSGLTKYFEHVFISEEVGFIKPHPEIFLHALKKAKAAASESIMIGDNYEADICGAAAVGMETIFFNPGKITNNYKRTYEIHELKELTIIL